MKPEFEDFSGYILAGGRSKRMGRDKAFLEINRKTFAENAVDILKPVCENRIKFVISRDQTHFIEKLPRKIPVIFDIYKDRGPLGGVHAALENCETKFVVVLAVDLPFVEGKFIEKMANEAKEFSKSIITRGVDNKIPLCAILHRASVLKTISELLSAKVSARFRKVFELIEPQEILCAKTQQFRNINTLRDLERAGNGS